MSVFRVEKNGNYTVMSNYHLDDKRLSLKAIGLLSKILRLPPDWDFTLEGLAAISKDGVASIRTGIEELESCGYIRRCQTHKSNGTFGGNDYTVYERPPDDAPPLCENRTTVAPLCENPIADSPIAENRRQINTYIPSTIPPKAPQGARRGRRKSSCDYEPELFEQFWTAYPRGEDKAAARYEWDMLKPDRELIGVMSAALDRQKNTAEWRRGIGVPYACRWLRYRRWEDEGDKRQGVDSQASIYSGEEALPWI